MADWLDSMKQQEEEIANQAGRMALSEQSSSRNVTNDTAISNLPTNDKPVADEPVGDVSSGSDKPKTEDVPTDREEQSLLRKMLRTCLVHNSKDSLEVIRRDPKSPLFSITSFEELRLKPELLKGVYAMGFMTPSKIQEAALPALIGDERSNIIAQSQSGTGKTAAFVLTMLSRVDISRPYVQCICLAPTYELALQIGDVTKKMAQFMKGIVIEYGVRGKRVEKDRELPCHILIGTPGTVMDWCFRYRIINLSKVKVYVLDEADVMIDRQGHAMHSLKIKEKLDRQCQILLFSATYNEEVMKYANSVVPNPMVIRLRREEETLENISQYYMECQTTEEKFRALSNIYGAISIGQAVIFCKTKKCAAQLTERMSNGGHAVGLLSGELTVEQRDAIIKRFREGKEKVLISTNVSARGIDVEKVTIVVNFDLPVDMNGGVDFETYLHRIGRTGRFGMHGLAINMIDSPESMQMLKAIESHFGRKIVKVDPEDLDEIERIGE